MTCTDASTAHCEPDRPSDRDVDRRTPQYRAAMAALGQVTGVPVGTVTACRNGIIQGAKPTLRYGSMRSAPGTFS
jgi:hypothetical protein